MGRRRLTRKGIIFLKTLRVEKDCCESRNVPIKSPCVLLVYLCLSPGDLIFSEREDPYIILVQFPFFHLILQNVLSAWFQQRFSLFCHFKYLVIIDSSTNNSFRKNSKTLGRYRKTFQLRVRAELMIHVQHFKKEFQYARNISHDISYLSDILITIRTK